jgi:hypothetical protein
MKPINTQNITALAGIGALCALAILGLCLSPAFGTDLGTTLSVVRSIIYPLCAIKFRLLPFGACARVSIDRLISMF